jgi:hypothetical protein
VCSDWEGNVELSTATPYSKERGGNQLYPEEKMDLLLSIPNVLTFLQQMIFRLHSSSTRVPQILSPTLCHHLITGVFYSARKTTGLPSRPKFTCCFIGHWRSMEWPLHTTAMSLFHREQPTRPSSPCKTCKLELYLKKKARACLRGCWAAQKYHVWKCARVAAKSSSMDGRCNLLHPHLYVHLFWHNCWGTW